MMSITQAFSSALLHFIWQGALVCGLLWAALFLLKQRSAGLRYFASCAALATLALLPPLTLYFLYAPPDEVALTAPVYSMGQEVSIDSAASSSAVFAWASWAGMWVLPLWSAGVVVFSIRLLWSCRQVSVLRRRGAQAERRIVELVTRLAERAGVHRQVRVLVSSIAEGPSTVGWLRPVVLLPAATIMGLTPEQLEVVIAHEIAHIRRNDYLVSALQIVVETLLFYHPAVWWTSARIRHERELCCDDAVVATFGDPVGYARALAALEKLRIAPPRLAMSSAGGSLLYRIQRLVGDRSSEKGTAKLAGALPLALGVLCLAMNMTGAQAEPQQGSPESLRTSLEHQWLKENAAIITEREKAVFAALRTEEERLHFIEQFWARLKTATVNEGWADEENATSGEVVKRKLQKPAVSWLPDSEGVAVSLGGAAILHRTPVQYPKAAYEKGVEGIVAVEATIDAAGNVTDARVLNGPQELRRAALESVLQWHFEASSAAGARTIQIEFDLLQAKQQFEAVVKKVIPAEKLLEEKKVKEIAKMNLPKKVAPTALSGMLGRTLRRVRVVGLSEQARTALESVLPVREGERLTAESIERTTVAVRTFDEHLIRRWVAVGDDGIELVIASPSPR